MGVVTPLNNPGGPEGDTVTVAEKLLNTEYCDEGDVMRAHKNAAAEARENECGSAPHRCACAHRHTQLQRDTLRLRLAQTGPEEV